MRNKLNFIRVSKNGISRTITLEECKYVLNMVHGHKTDRIEEVIASQKMSPESTVSYESYAKMNAEVHRMSAPNVEAYPFTSRAAINKALIDTLDLFHGTSSDWFGSSKLEMNKLSIKWTEFTKKVIDDYRKDDLSNIIKEAHESIKIASVIHSKVEKKSKRRRKASRIASGVSSENNEETCTPPTSVEDCLLLKQGEDTLPAPSVAISGNDSVVDGVNCVKTDLSATGDSTEQPENLADGVELDKVLTSFARTTIDTQSSDEKVFQKSPKSMLKKIELTDIEHQMTETTGLHNDKLINAWDKFFDKQVEEIGVYAKQLSDRLLESGKKDAEEARTLYDRQVKDWEARAMKDSEEARTLYEGQVKEREARAIEDAEEARILYERQVKEREASAKEDAEEARILYERQVTDWEARAEKYAEEACSLYENHVKDLETRANKMANDFIEYSRQNIDKARKFAREQDSELSKPGNRESR